MAGKVSVWARRAVSAALWVLLVGVSVVLLRSRLESARIDGRGYDLAIYLRAAQAVAQGRSPYTVDGYVYSPLLAVVLAPFADAVWIDDAWTGFLLLSGLVAVVLVVLSVPGMRGWRLPVALGFATVTLYWSHLANVDLGLGQIDVLLVAVFALAATLSARPRAAGALIAVAGLLKTWPAAALLWCWRRGGSHPGEATLAAAAVLAVTAALTALAWGPSAVAEWVAVTVRWAQQPHPSFSLPGLARHLFTPNGEVDALVDAPMLAGFVAAVGWVIIALAAWVVLRMPGAPALALWHLIALIVIALPVSHYQYRVLWMPLLWIWAARLLGGRRRLRDAGVLGVLLLWWWVTARTIVETSTHVDTGWYVVVMATSVLALGASILVEARSASETVATRAENVAAGVEVSSSADSRSV